MPSEFTQFHIITLAAFALIILFNAAFAAFALSSGGKKRCVAVGIIALVFDVAVILAAVWTLLDKYASGYDFTFGLTVAEKFFACVSEYELFTWTAIATVAAALFGVIALIIKRCMARKSEKAKPALAENDAAPVEEILPAERNFADERILSVTPDEKIIHVGAFTETCVIGGKTVHKTDAASLYAEYVNEKKLGGEK